MSIRVNVHEAKTRLSELLAAVERGEDVIIARAGIPVARLNRFAPAGIGENMPKRQLGWLAGEHILPGSREEWEAMDRQLDAEIAAEFMRDRDGEL